jgi:hypothetical protein
MSIEIASGIFVPLFLFGLGWLVTAISYRIDAQRERIKRLKEYFTDFDKIAVEYWCRDNDPKDATCEIKILSYQSLIQEYEYFAEKDLGPFYDYYNNIVIDLLANVTGGDFQTANRKSDQDRALATRKLLFKISLVFDKSLDLMIVLERRKDDCAMYLSGLFTRAG